MTRLRHILNRTEISTAQRRLSFLPLWIIACLPTIHQAIAAVEPASLVVLPSASGETAHFDFGKIGPLEYSRAEHVFILSNPTANAVEIDEVKPTCGCTSAAIGNQGLAVQLPYVLPPHGSLDVKVTLAPGKVVSGWVDKFVGVYADKRNVPTLRLEISGVIDPGFSIFPALVDFGSVPAASDASVLVTVSLTPSLLPAGCQPRLVSSNKYISIRELTVTRDEPKAVDVTNSRSSGGPTSNVNPDIRIRTFKVALLRNAPLGILRGMLYLDQTDPARTKLEENRNAGQATNHDGPGVPLTGNVIGDVSLSPEFAALGTVKHGDRKTLSISISGRRPDSLIGLTVKSGLPSVEARLVRAAKSPIGVKSGLSLDVSVASTAPIGLIDTEIVLTTAGGQHFILPVVAEVARPNGDGIVGDHK